MATEAPGAAKTPKTTDFRLLKKIKFPPKVQPRLLVSLKAVWQGTLGAAQRLRRRPSGVHCRGRRPGKEPLAPSWGGSFIGIP